MLEKLLFGKLTTAAILPEPLVQYTFVVVAILGVVVLGLVTYTKSWGWIWRDYICSVDHKKIGIMYLIVSFIMLVRGFSDAVLMRLQQMMAVGHHMGFLPPDHYDQIFTAHGVIMIFIVAMGFVFGLANILIPQQIGARDVAYPFLNNLSFWLYAMATGIIMMSLFVGTFAKTGWLAYPPLSEKAYSPGVGVDYYLWALNISGIGTLLGGINIFVTILKMRCPGMTLMRMPIFVWATLCSMFLVIVSFPILNITLIMLFLDRFMDMHFFTSAFGGNMMLYINLIWTWGHPEVYILVLPVFGVYSEIVSAYCKKTLFGYTSMVWATAAITILAFSVWVHHFFTMGAGPDVNSFFSIATMIISIPTGVKIFNWLFTMYRGRIQFTVPMIYTIAFLITFTIGGMTGVLLAIPGVNFQLHNTVFVIAHFHNTIIGGVVFGLFAAITYWYPKIFGYKLNEKLGKIAAYFWITGFYVAFMPLYALGFMGMTRRMQDPANPIWHPYLVIAACGAALILIGVIFQVIMIVVSMKNRRKPEYLDSTGDPWDGRTLEWSVPSPTPFYNFVTIPTVDSIDPYWEEKKANGGKPLNKKPEYKDIHMPKNTSLGFWIALFAGLFCFAMVWDMTIPAIVGAVMTVVLTIARFFQYDTDYYVKASEVEQIDMAARGGYA